MKQLNIKLILAVLMSMVGLSASAHDIAVKNAQGVTIYYNFIKYGAELEVTSRGTSYNTYMNEYTGNVVIPENVSYNGKTYKVTSIESTAFAYCTGLISVTIPNSVTSIGWYAFRDCTSLTSVTIGSGVNVIGKYAFYHCKGLTSITIPNSSIGEYAFLGCSGLTSVTIGSGVTSIGYWAFEGVDIPTIISLIENPSAISDKTSTYRTFSLYTFNNATLYVPKGTIEKYKATNGWKDFANIVEGTPTAIKDVKQDAGAFDRPATIYNLKGELQTAPLEALPHGIYIVNGKTVVK